MSRSKQGTCGMSQTTRSPHSRPNEFSVFPGTFSVALSHSALSFRSARLSRLVVDLQGRFDSLTNLLSIDAECRLGYPDIVKRWKPLMDKSQRVAATGSAGPRSGRERILKRKRRMTDAAEKVSGPATKKAKTGPVGRPSRFVPGARPRPWELQDLEHGQGCRWWGWTRDGLGRGGRDG